MGQTDCHDYNWDQSTAATDFTLPNHVAVEIGGRLPLVGRGKYAHGSP